MIKFTKLIKSVLLLSFLLLMTNCVTNDADENSRINSFNEAKIWYNSHKEDYSATILKYAVNLQWENAIVSNGKDGEVVEIPFTLDGNLSASNEKASLNNDSHRLMFLKYGQKDYKFYYVQIFADNNNSKISDKDYSYYNINSNFDGKVFIQDLSTKAVNKLEFKNGNKVEPSLTGKMREDMIDCVYLGYWYEDGHFEAVELVYCEGAGEVTEPKPIGGGGGGGTTPSVPSVEDDAPPSCQSFNFSVTASLWQTALVKNISFNIILLSETGVTFIHSAKFRQPISFGMPTNHSVGGAPISAGMAAELSAKALQMTIKDVVAKYGRVKVSEMIVEQYFKERLIYNYPLVTSGGRVNWTATENLPVTDYETTFLLPDDCE